MTKKTKLFVVHFAIEYVASYRPTENKLTLIIELKKDTAADT
jgi:hypothetical protein